MINTNLVNISVYILQRDNELMKNKSYYGFYDF